MAGDGSLSFRLFGNLEICRDGRPLALPPSKKTRALIAFLLVTGRSHRREKLCSLLWDLPYDPRGALRWSLSKARGLVDEPDRPRIVAHQETVAFDATGVEVDLFAVRDLARDGLAKVTTERLKAVGEAIGGEFLDGLDLPNLHEYQAWLVAERADALTLQMTVYDALVERLSATPDEALPFARMAVQLDPDNPAAHARLETLLAARTRKRRRHRPAEGGADSRQWADIPAAGPPDPAGPAETVLPSIAVLPFENLGRDPEQDYFSDGVTEDVITALARFRWLRIASRTSSFAYRGGGSDPARIARDLNVRYVVKGSVRRSGDRLRVSAHLLDAVNHSHLWDGRYDRNVADLLSLQDEIANAIVAEIAPELEDRERQRASRKRPEGLAVWDLYQRGLWHMYRYTAEDNAEAQEMFRQAAERDPLFAPALAGLAQNSYNAIVQGFTGDPDRMLLEGHDAARRALALDGRDAITHMVLGQLSIMSGDYESGLAEVDNAVALNPSFARLYYGHGWANLFAGRLDVAHAALDKALRLGPHDPTNWVALTLRALCYLVEGDDEAALHWAREAVRRPLALFWAHAGLAAALGHLGKKDEARRVAQQLLTMKPDFTRAFVAATLPFREKKHRDRYLQGLDKAGVP